jgi:uncharacterized protein YprB with RNaseH-like and TPR domain
VTSLELVALDIETTGFGVDDEVTVVGFALPLGVWVACQTGGREPQDIEAALREPIDTHVQVTAHDTERALFHAVDEFAGQRLRGEDVLLTAYNGETWNAGFDLPFLRTRAAWLNVDWPLRDLPYADLLPVVTQRFNTTRTEDADQSGQTDLESIYETLGDGSYDDYDPFADSGEAVTAFEEGRFDELVLHNVADVLRTRQLGRLAQRYCSKSDFSLKSLTPIRND